MKNFACAAVMVVSTLAAAAPPSHAQQWPSKNIHVIIPLGAGSATDVVPRMVFDQMAPQLGQSIIVENRPGAGTTIGTGAVARAEPDGYTLLATSSAYSVAPSMSFNMTYDPIKDLIPVATFVSLPNVFIIAPSKGFKTLKEYVEWARKNKGAATYSSVGTGSGVHFNAEKLRQAAGFEAVHVPFKSGPEALTEVITGRVDFYMCPINTALPYIRDGKVLALAIGTKTRSSLLPDVPTTIEAGFPNSEYDIWVGLLAPAKTPQPIIDKLSSEMTKALEDPAIKEKLAKTGLEPMITSPADFSARIAREIPENAAIAKAADLKAN
jgi:tripartite-type tricarboxylate transporter receptor subunit TctC